MTCNSHDTDDAIPCAIRFHVPDHHTRGTALFLSDSQAGRACALCTNARLFVKSTLPLHVVDAAKTLCMDLPFRSFPPSFP